MRHCFLSPRCTWDKKHTHHVCLIQGLFSVVQLLFQISFLFAKHLLYTWSILGPVFSRERSDNINLNHIITCGLTVWNYRIWICEENQTSMAYFLFVWFTSHNLQEGSGYSVEYSINHHHYFSFFLSYLFFFLFTEPNATKQHLTPPC